MQLVRPISISQSSLSFHQNEVVLREYVVQHAVRLTLRDSSFAANVADHFPILDYAAPRPKNLTP